MIKVMIVDDEPYIRQGLGILIDWEKYGFQICGEASNGKEAAELLSHEIFDLVITDIKMPQMDGLELISYTWDNISKETRFIILSGFYEFEYAKKAIKYNVLDYILKPVQKEELVRVLEECRVYYLKRKEDKKEKEYSDKIIYDRHLSNLISGCCTEGKDYEYVKKYLFNPGYFRYIGIELDSFDEDFVMLSEDNKIKSKQLLYDSMKEYLGMQGHYSIMDYRGNEDDIGFLFMKRSAEEYSLTEKDYINNLYQALKIKTAYNFYIYIGQRVENLEQISESYKTATIAKAFQGFTGDRDIAYYEEVENKLGTNRYRFDKELLDALIRAIEENDLETVNVSIDHLYKFFQEIVAEPEIIKINVDYLLFHLINLAKELNPDLDQEEILKKINQGGFDQKAIRGSSKHFKNFANEFSNYLGQLRQHALGGILTEIEKEITENYRDNLSLKSLSEKYYINSAYLGQIFKKQYGVSFKDYLNSYRIDRATEMLIRTDEKIYLVSTAVGFNNTDYFISKFVQIKGTTPLQYRKQFLK